MGAPAVQTRGSRAPPRLSSRLKLCKPAASASGLNLGPIIFGGGGGVLHAMGEIGLIPGLVAIFACDLAGEALSRGLGLPLPGPVLGLALLFAALLARDRFGGPGWPRFTRDGSVERAGETLVASLSLLFVPPGVGVVASLDVFATSGVALAAAILASTTLALAATALVFMAFAQAPEP